MEWITTEKEKETWELEEILAEDAPGKRACVCGAVQRIRDMGEITFVILRKRDGILQTVFERGNGPDVSVLCKEACVQISGVIRAETRAPGGRELYADELRILSRPDEPMPIAVSGKQSGASLETRLDLRPLSLRGLRERARFKIQEGVARAFREYLQAEGFTEIHTPKIGARGAEGGANLFRLEYFHRPAVLAQSPQFYKQMMAAVFERVMEIGPVFRAEKHNTRRHLNEYVSLDLEMAYLTDFTDLMRLETGYLAYLTRLLSAEYAPELALLGVTLPQTDRIPAVRFSEARRLAAEKYGVPIRSPYDLEPDEEQRIGRYFQEECGADFVFVTHYPSRKRPFYTMPSPEDPEVTESFDLLFRGMEVTTGGQRIHDWKMLTERIAARGMDTEGMEAYLSAFRHGMPPHGGLGIGLERMTMQLLGEENVREVSLFPRDQRRLTP